MNSGRVFAGTSGLAASRKGRAADHADSRDVAHEIERQVRIKAGVDRIRVGGEEQRVAVRGRSHDILGSKTAACARPVLNDELLTEPVPDPLSDQAGDDVGPAAGRKADDHAHRSCRIIERPGNARQHRQRRGTRSHLQKSPAAKFHGISRNAFARLMAFSRAARPRRCSGAAFGAVRSANRCVRAGTRGCPT